MTHPRRIYDSGIFVPLWFKRDVALLEKQFASGQITRARFDDEIETINKELDLRNAEFRAGRG